MIVRCFSKEPCVWINVSICITKSLPASSLHTIATEWRNIRCKQAVTFSEAARELPYPPGNVPLWWASAVSHQCASFNDAQWVHLTSGWTGTHLYVKFVWTLMTDQIVFTLICRGLCACCSRVQVCIVSRISSSKLKTVTAQTAVHQILKLIHTFKHWSLDLMWCWNNLENTFFWSDQALVLHKSKQQMSCCHSY